MMLVEFVEIEIAQVVVAGSIRKHVVDGHEDLVGHCHDGPLVDSRRVSGSYNRRDGAGGCC